MATSFVRRWVRLSLPVGMLLVGLGMRLTGVLPGWATLLILGGIIGGALAAYVILLGEHERTILVDRATVEATIDPGSLRHPFRTEWGSGYDGR